jgi:glutamine amidotransferase
MSEVILIDAGTGNLRSVANALLRLNVSLRVTQSPAEWKGQRAVLPGVGAFSAFMEGLRQNGWIEVLNEHVRRGYPLLGICVGMQALFQWSEEGGQVAGLGLLPGQVKRFPSLEGLKIPHTGWNQLRFCRPSDLFQNLTEGEYVYFNHSYYCVPEQEEDCIARTDYGLTFCSAVQRDALWGVQFHPEKSQTVGKQILENFLSL